MRKLTRILVAMIENIRDEEKRNTRIAYNHQKQRMGKSSDDDRTRRDAKIQQIYNRMEFLRRSCRCRFICTGLSELVWSFKLILVRENLTFNLTFPKDHEKLAKSWCSSKINYKSNCIASFKQLQIKTNSNFQCISSVIYSLCYLVVTNKCLQTKFFQCDVRYRWHRCLW